MLRPRWQAETIYLHNPWLTYTMGLHRLRELALAPPVIDRLNEEPLGLDEILEVCEMLFSNEDGVGVDWPHPKKDWDGFVRALRASVAKDVPQWNPVKKRMTPWIDVEKLASMHRGGERSSFLRNSLHKSNAGLPPEQQRSEPTNRPTLPEVLKRWSRQPPDYDLYYPLETLLVTVPRTFPPTNAAVEPHGYFARWPIFDEGAFAEERGEGLRNLLRRGAFFTRV